MKKPEVIDAEFEVVSGRSPVRWQPQKQTVSAELKWMRAIFGGLIVGAALLTLLVGLAGGDIDTRDEVAAWKAAQPSAVEIR